MELSSRELHCPQKKPTCVSFSTLIASTFPNLSSHSPFTSSASSLSQSRSVSLRNQGCYWHAADLRCDKDVLFRLKHILQQYGLRLHCLRNGGFRSETTDDNKKKATRKMIGPYTGSGRD